MNNRHSHPAHRIPVEAPLNEPFEGSSLPELIRALADTAMASETPGVHRDDLSDQLIALARKWVEREDRNSSFIAELS